MDVVTSPVLQLPSPVPSPQETGRQGGVKSGQVRRMKSANWLERRRLRVRALIGRLDDMVGVETDAQKLDRLASAQAKLAEQERILDGRPLPGSRKPRPERTPSGPQWTKPAD